VAEQRRRLNRLNAEEVRLRAMESQVRYQQRRLQLQQQEAEHALKALASPAKSPARPTVKSTPSSQLRSVPAVAQPAASAEDEKLSMPEHERRVAWYNHQMQLYKRQMQAHEHAIHDLKSQEEQLSNLLENGAEEDEEQYQQLLDLYAKLQEQQSRQQQLEEQQRLLSELQVCLECNPHFTLKTKLNPHTHSSIFVSFQIELQTAAQLQHQRQVLHQAEQQASQAVFDQQTPREQTREELPPRPASATPKRAMRHNQQQ
jgi:predicted nuclease with TOPRIM domain